MAKIGKTYIKAMKKLGIDDSGNQIQENIAAAIEPILRLPIINGILLKNISLQVGVIKKISHTLGRMPQGWIVVRKDANSNIWQVNNDELSSTLLQLEASANVTIDLWVF